MKLLLLLLIIVVISGCNTTNVFVDSRDGQRYKYVAIKERYWMTENMRYNIEGSRYNTNNPDTIYGRLYTWDQAMLACPEGWKLPSTYAWMSLEDFFIKKTKDIIGMKKFRGNNVKILKSRKDWSTPGTDSLKLNILPAGIATDYGGFNQLGKGTFFWTSSPHLVNGQSLEGFADFRYIHNDSLGVYYDVHGTDNHYMSCRCVQIIPKEERKNRKCSNGNF